MFKMKELRGKRMASDGTNQKFILAGINRVVTKISE